MKNLYEIKLLPYIKIISSNPPQKKFQREKMDKYVSRYPESPSKAKSEAPQREKTNGNSSNFNNSTLVDINSTPPVELSLPLLPRI